jgi:hypothetical protein
MAVDPGCSVTGRPPSGRHRGRPSIGRRKRESWCASNLIKSAQLTLGLPVLKPSAIRRARTSEMNALNSPKAGSARFDALTDRLCRVGPENFTRAPQRSVREPLDSYGSCHRAKAASFPGSSVRVTIDLDQWAADNSFNADRGDSRLSGTPKKQARRTAKRGTAPKTIYRGRSF